MANNSRPHTCLSDASHVPHDDRIQDVTLHYFGCLAQPQQAEFYSRLSRKSKRRISAEIQRVRRTRLFFEAHPKSKAGVDLGKFKASLRDWRQLTNRRPPDQGVHWPLENEYEGSVDADMKAAMIFFKNSRPYTDPGFHNNFPNQKISIQDLLADNEQINPLMQPCGEDVIRYFHFPANNMTWIEEAIARYYHEERPRTGDLFARSRPQARTKAQMLLRPEFWRGQQHGDRSSVIHSRYMRPLCEGISIDPISSEISPKNLVLFMPYLHWETDRARAKYANTIKEAGKTDLSTIVEIVDRVAVNEQAGPPVQTFAHESVGHSSSNQILSSNSEGPSARELRRAAVRRILLLAASLAEAMECHVDEKLVYEYLHKDPPLHPRRTLDQSYYGRLKNTESRDRDQVVYRATTSEQHECVAKISDERCGACQENIRKVPRVIMVDQLWLWILDEKTIITCFPRRWGKNIADPSAVHKSVRTRLKMAREDEIRSVYDLALIIVDECSRVFFDRTKAIDRQPNLVDIFSDVISGMTSMQTAAFDQFLTYSTLASKEYNSTDKSGTSATQNTLLNINHEGKLLKEVKDILDELHILTRIKIQQQVVAEAFVKHIRAVLLPKISPTGGSGIDRTSRGNFLSSATGEILQEDEISAAQWTLRRADNLLKGVQDRINELNTLADSAKNTSASLKDLLTLKQQQAGVVEAREAVKQATETLKQGRSIMLFTVVTIIFAPLSFCASIFGMNSYEFNQSSLKLHQQFVYMFPISAAIICISLILAFTNSTFLSAFTSLIWAIVSYPVNAALTWVLTKTGLYTLSRELATRAITLKDMDRKKTAMMKANAMREKIEQRGLRDLHGMRQLRGMMELGVREVEGVELREVLGSGNGGVMCDVESGVSSRSESRIYSPRL